MDSPAIAALRKDAYKQIDQLTEDTLLLLVEFLKTINDQESEPQHKAVARKPGIAKGKFVCPDDIDEDNEMIASWFEGKNHDAFNS